jgi:hypothetical protein
MAEVSMVHEYLAERGQPRKKSQDPWLITPRCETSVYVVLLVIVLSVLLVIYSPFTAKLNLLLLSLISAPPLLAFFLEASLREPAPVNQADIDEANEIACKKCFALDGVFVLIFILLLQVLVLNFSPAETKLNVIAVCLLLVPPACAYAFKWQMIPPTAAVCFKSSCVESESYVEIPELSFNGCSEEIIRSYNEDL